MPKSLKPHKIEKYQKVTYKLKKSNTISLGQKIELFEKFMQTGEELDGNTIFEGYPIGQWAITIRSNLNTANSSKNSRVKIRITEEQLERLRKLK